MGPEERTGGEEPGGVEGGETVLEKSLFSIKGEKQANPAKLCCSHHCSHHHSQFTRWNLATRKFLSVSTILISDMCKQIQILEPEIEMITKMQ